MNNVGTNGRQNLFLFYQISYTIARAAESKHASIMRLARARVKCELRVAKLRVGILRVEVRAKRASI